MVDRGGLSQALVAAVAEEGHDAALAVCRAVVAWVPMAGAAITLMSGPDRQVPVCATDAGAARIDELQFTLGDGPCVTAARTGRAVLVADIADSRDTRWPAFAAAAARTGARGMFVLPLRVGSSRLGVLDCYRRTPGSLTRDDLQAALQAADAAVWTLLDRVEPRILGDENTGWEWFDGSPLTRAEVHQATGMLSVQADLSLPAALARLRSVAFSTGRPIAELAAQVVARRYRLDADGSWTTGGPTGTGHPNGTVPPGSDTPDPGESGSEENPV